LETRKGGPQETKKKKKNKGLQSAWTSGTGERKREPTKKTKRKKGEIREGKWNPAAVRAQHFATSKKKKEKEINRKATPRPGHTKNKRLTGRFTKEERIGGEGKSVSKPRSRST